MNKKGIVAVIIGVILVISGLILVLYLFFFAEDPEEVVQGLRDALPFGDRSSSIRDSDSVDVPDEPSRPVDKERVLRRLSEHPVAEGGAYSFVKDGETYVRYISRGEGNLYELKLSEYEGHDTLLGNNEGLFSGAHKVSWIDENNVIIYSLENDGYVANIATVSFSEDGDGLVWSGGQLPDETLTYAISPEDRTFFYAIREDSGIRGFTASFGSVGTVTGRHVFSSPFREWTADWPSRNVVTLTTKPSGHVPGHMYTLDPTSGSVSHVLRGIYGLTTNTNNDASFILYNESVGNGVSINFYDNQEKAHNNIKDIVTMADKCLWKEKDILICAVPASIPSATYPDAWYQGKVSFNDDGFKKVNISNNTVKKYFTPGDLRTGVEEMDAYELFFDDEKKNLFFIDKKTGHLWVYHIPE